MKLVVVLPYAPWPVTKGLDRLVVNLLAGLSARHDVALVTMALDRARLEGLRAIERPRLSVRAILAPHRRSGAQRVWRKARYAAALVCAGTPMQVSYSAPPELLDLAAETARSTRPDLVIAFYWHLHRLPGRLPGARLALATMDLDFLVRAGRIVSAGPGPARAIEALRTRLLERVELDAYRRYDTILTATEADAERLRRHPVAAGKKIYALPLGLDLREFDPASFARVPDTVLFSGAFHADFNRDALRWMLGGIWPLVRERRPSARLEIVGFGVDDRALALAGPGVSFAGGVEDVRPRLGACAVLVLPLRFGGGVRIRMMEAAAMAIPVVSTPVGVAGMGLAAGREYLEAGDAGAFAEAIVRLLESPDDAARLGRAARAWAERAISMDTYPGRLDELLSRLAGSR